MSTASAAVQNYSVSKVGLFLNGRSAGLLKSADGGEAYAEVQLEPGEIFDRKTIILPPKYEDIVMQAGTSMNDRFYEWIAAAWEGKSEPQEGSVVTFDYDYKPKAVRNFQEAFITETRFPALDASAKDPTYLTLNLDPASTQLEDPSGQDVGGGLQNKPWLAGNFRLDIPGLDCTKVNKIDSFTVKSTQGEKPKVEFSNLKITMAVSGAESWNKWYRKSVIYGNTELEFAGKLITLDNTLSNRLISVDLEGLGIVRLSPEKLVAGSDNVARVVAEVYVERMHFNGPPS